MKKLVLLLFFVLIFFSPKAQDLNNLEKLKLAVTNNDTAAIQKLKKTGADINTLDSGGNNILLYALENGFLSMADYLIGIGVDVNVVNKKGYSSLFYAIADSGSEFIVKEIVKKGNISNSVNSKGATPFQFALNNSRFEIATILLESGADVSNVTWEGLNSMHIAVLVNSADFIEKLADKKVNINQQDKNGMTPLLYAIKNKNTPIALKLIELGADVSIQDSYHYFPMLYIADNNDSLLFDKLIEKKAMVESQEYNLYPILLAASNENSHFVKKILEAGATIPEPNKNPHLYYGKAFIYEIQARSKSSEREKYLKKSLSWYKKTLTLISDMERQNSSPQLKEIAKNTNANDPYKGSLSNKTFFYDDRDYRHGKEIKSNQFPVESDELSTLKERCNNKIEKLKREIE